MTQSPYPELLDKQDLTVDDLASVLREIIQVRGDDVGDFDNVNNRLAKINTANTVLLGNGDNTVNTTDVGDAGQVLTSNGAGNDPTFETGSAIPSGGIIPYGGASAPSGWLLCYGQAVSRTTYATLFTAISDTYGVGDGSTTFNLPDLRGRTVAGQDDMGGVSADRLTDQSGGLDGDVLGDTGGSETHTLTTAELALHGHPFRTGDGGQGNTSGGLMTDTDGTQTSRAAYTGAVSGTNGQQIGGEGGDGAHNNVQPTIILNYVIKT